MTSLAPAPADVPPAAPLLQQVLGPITPDLHRVDALIRERLRSDVPLVNQIGAHIVAAGGKRLRPAALLLTARALGAPESASALLAVVIEFIHTATLLHDDVIDQASRRRGRATANAVWGNSAAVLCGDFLYSRSFQLMVEAGRPAVMSLMADTTNAIAEGEVLQLMNVRDPEVSEETYLRVIELKTARLFEAAAGLGAIAADASSAVVLQMRRFGHNVGMAYQLIDDMLDYTADASLSGKNIGIDLAEGKPTLPLIYAMRAGSELHQRLIRRAIAEGGHDDIASIRSAVEVAGAIPYTRALATRYGEAALAVLAGLPESPFLRALADLARLSADRNA
jgi:octaprenyl-diphosphate synthase